MITKDKLAAEALHLMEKNQPALLPCYQLINTE